MHTASQALAIERQASAQPSLAERVSRPKTRAILGLMRLNFLSVRPAVAPRARLPDIGRLHPADPGPRRERSHRDELNDDALDMANATNTLVGRSVGHEWAVSVATSGHFCWPPTGSSYWPLTPASGRGDDLSRGRLRRDAVPARSDDEPVHPSRGAGCSVLGARGGRPRSDATWFGVVGQGEADPRGVIAVRANGFPA